MNWEALGAIGEVVGALGVIVTLVYLALQIKSSAKATEAQVHANLSAEMEHLSSTIAQDDALSEAMSLALQGKELTNVQQVKLSWWFGGILRVCESHIIQRLLGATDINLEKPVTAILSHYARIGFFHNLMTNSVKSGTATAEFLEFLDKEVLSKTEEIHGDNTDHLGTQALFGERDKNK